MAKDSGEKSDNPNAFKHAVSEATAKRLAGALVKAYPTFDAKGFVREARKALPPLELKPRIVFLSDAMAKRLPSDYPSALRIVLETLGPELGSDDAVSSGLFYYWIHASFVERHGLAHVPESLDAMREITKRSTSEFAVRPFLAQSPREVLTFLSACASDENEHVRRWVSEGTRPFLPWGTRAAPLLQKPFPALPLLHALRADESAYVRTSLANHLNDLARLDATLVVDTVRAWIDEGLPHAPAIAKRALRNLVKAGHPGALAVFGVSTKVHAALKELRLEKKKIRVGDKLVFEATLEGKARELLVVDYALTFPGAGDRQSRKVFKLVQRPIEEGERLTLRKQHSFRPITTRVYRAGKHKLELLLNGKVHAELEFTLAL
ncbi:MAG: DNA alkylation repair protein [Polyangiales bacterium]